jgi:hypothetical protein
LVKKLALMILILAVIPAAVVLLVGWAYGWYSVHIVGAGH